jgi:hypothetical protein
MAWKGDGSGRKDSAKGGVSGSKGGGGKGGSGNGGARTSPKAVSNATVADHAIATGRVAAPSIPSGGVARGNYNSQVDAYNDYSKAVGQYETRGFLDKALDFLGGAFYDSQEPMAGNPRSFSKGTFHSTSNPGGILGGLLGMAAPGLGMLTGPAVSSIYDAAGLPQMWHGGYDQPDLRNGLMGNTDAPMGGTLADAADKVGGGWFSGGKSPNMAGGGNNGISGRLASILGRPTRPTAPPGATAKPAALASAPPALTNYASKYLSVNAPGLQDYGIWTPFQRA